MKLKFFLTIISLFLCIFLKAQMPPAPEDASPENKILIDSLLKVTNYKEYFINYCDRQIDKAAITNKWSFDDTRQRKLKVNFQDFKEYTIYNTYAGLSKQELIELIKVFNKLNAGDSKMGWLFFPTHHVIQNNLEVFVQQFLK